MGNTVHDSSQFANAVQTLLDILSSGISMVRRQRRRRREGKTKTDSSIEKEESRLNKSLKRSRADVRAVYEQHLARFGRRFVKGDVKAKSSFASILSTLNTGFTSFMNKFRKGKSSPSDIHALVNLSNTSRREALKTFKHFSTRISQSSLPTASSKPKRKSQHSSKGEKDRHTNIPPSTSTKSQQKLLSAPPQSQRRLEKPKPLSPKLGKSSSDRPVVPASHGLEWLGDDRAHVRTLSIRPAPPLNRISMVSFLSESTKIGEIVERNNDVAMGPPTRPDHMADTAFPLSPWERPPKAPSRFRRLFGITG